MLASSESAKGAFGYHRTFREGLLEPSDCRQSSFGREGVWPSSHITFIVPKKSLIYNLFCSI